MRTGGEGVKNHENFADVIYGRSLMALAFFAHGHDSATSVVDGGCDVYFMALTFVRPSFLSSSSSRANMQKYVLGKWREGYRDRRQDVAQ